MKIILKFNLVKNETVDDGFLFWACALDSSIDEKIVDYKYLNKDNIYDIENCEPMRLKICYCEYSETKINGLIENLRERPAYFIASDRTFLSGSPYKNSSSSVKTYYCDTLEFVQNLRVFCGYDSGYKLNLLQNNTIRLIKKIIGIDILKNESTVGALSIYNKLPVFNIDGNYNSKLGERYITISALEDLSDYKDLIVQIEIIDNGKNLYNSLQKLSLDLKYKLPAELEDFSQIHISIFGKKTIDDITSKIYEERFHLIRSFNLSMSIGGGHSKIVYNRYLNKQIDKIDIYDHINNISNNPKDFFDIEQTYKLLIMGKKKEYLDSIYFINNQDGRTAFLNWIRGILHRAKIVKIIDPYFDNLGLNDFQSCSDTHFQLSIVTTDPDKRRKSKDNSITSDTKNLLKEILYVFPDCKIYYAPKLHDRYLFIDDGEEQKLYSFSNSWNGTVNHFSMYIQEVPLMPALGIYEEINTYISDKYLQNPPSAVTPGKYRRHGGKKYTGAYHEILLKRLKGITTDGNDCEIIDVTTELFFANYYGKGEKETIQREISGCFEELTETKIINIISIVVERLLKEQKKSFDKENRYMSGEPFLWYDTPRKCHERASNLSMWGEMRSYHLSLNYGLAELLSVCFALYPAQVIKTLSELEEKICVKKDTEKGTSILGYYVSEFIVQSFLLDYYPFGGKISEQAWDLIKKSDTYIYIRIFFAVSIVNEALSLTSECKLNFYDIVKIFSGLCLTHSDIAVVLGRALNNIILRKRTQNNLEIDYQESIIRHVAEKSDKQGVIDFSFIAFLEPFDILTKDFFEFLKVLKHFGRISEAETVEKLFLVYALQTNPKLQDKVSSLIGIDKRQLPDYLSNKVPIDKEPSDIDIRKFIPVLRYLGSFFAECLEDTKDDSTFDKIVFSLSADKSLIFNTKFPDKLTLFYYELFFLLNTVHYMKNQNTGSREILEFADWFLPLCIDSFPDDFYGLGLKIIGLYVEMIPNEKKEALLEKLSYLPMRALIASTISEQSDKTIGIYGKYVTKCNIDTHDKSIQVENLLTIGISLCIRCTEECNKESVPELLTFVDKINQKIKPYIVETVKPILDCGIKYAKTPSGEDKDAFFDLMRNRFLPYQAENFLEDKNV